MQVALARVRLPFFWAEVWSCLLAFPLAVPTLNEGAEFWDEVGLCPTILLFLTAILVKIHSKYCQQHWEPKCSRVHPAFTVTCAQFRWANPRSGSLFYWSFALPLPLHSFSSKNGRKHAEWPKSTFVLHLLSLVSNLKVPPDFSEVRRK